MATDAQIKANKANAQKSTGPKTPEGKATSSQNAIVHGLSAKRLLIEGEDAAEFESVREQIFSEFTPESALEIQLVEKLAADLWRLRRIPAVEALLVDWVSYEEARTYDTNANEVYPAMCHSRSLRSHPTDKGVKSRYMIGRALQVMLSGSDLFSKLARHETHIFNQLKQTLKMLEQLKRTDGSHGASSEEVVRSERARIRLVDL